MRPRSKLAAATALLVGLSACGGDEPGDGPVHRLRVPAGASFGAVADSLEAKEILGSTTVLRLYARITGQAGDIQAGTYEFREGAGWRKVLDDLTAGRVAAERLVVPEGWDIQRIGPALARIVDQPADSLLEYMLDTATARQFGVPGPTLEGYLYPATYIVLAGTEVDSVLARMVGEYQEVWTRDRRARADSIGLSEREVTTLASIVEKEAKIADEMPTIAAVYHNRLDIGYPLQADPTVQYALGEHQNRLLYAHIDSVSKHPYNTYTQRGLPPGPIGSPSARAIDAVLQPADVNYLYFVARPDGSHVFNRHLVDHNKAKAQIRREAEAGRREAAREEAEREARSAGGEPSADSTAAVLPGSRRQPR